MRSLLLTTVLTAVALLWTTPLLNALPPDSAVNISSCMSATIEYGVDRAGGHMGARVLPAGSDAWDCAVFCLRDPRCFGWTFQHYDEGSGCSSDPRCWLMFERRGISSTTNCRASGHVVHVTDSCCGQACPAIPAAVLAVNELASLDPDDATHAVVALRAANGYDLAMNLATLQVYMRETNDVFHSTTDGYSALWRIPLNENDADIIISATDPTICLGRNGSALVGVSCVGPPSPPTWARHRSRCVLDDTETNRRRLAHWTIDGSGTQCLVRPGDNLIELGPCGGTTQLTDSALIEICPGHRMHCQDVLRFDTCSTDTTSAATSRVQCGTQSSVPLSNLEPPSSVRMSYEHSASIRGGRRIGFIGGRTRPAMALYGSAASLSLSDASGSENITLLDQLPGPYAPFVSTVRATSLAARFGSAAAENETVTVAVTFSLRCDSAAAENQLQYTPIVSSSPSGAGAVDAYLRQANWALFVNHRRQVVLSVRHDWMERSQILLRTTGRVHLNDGWTSVVLRWSHTNSTGGFVDMQVYSISDSPSSDVSVDPLTTFEQLRHDYGTENVHSTTNSGDGMQWTQLSGVPMDAIDDSVAQLSCGGADVAIDESSGGGASDDDQRASCGIVLDDVRTSNYLWDDATIEAYNVRGIVAADESAGEVESTRCSGSPPCHSVGSRIDTPYEEDGGSTVCVCHDGDEFGYWTGSTCDACLHGFDTAERCLAVASPSSTPMATPSMSPTPSATVCSTCAPCFDASANLLPDADGDNVADSCDNCPNTPNADQDDSDSDGVGNACDNCIHESNAGQEDGDSDGLGDDCDECALIAYGMPSGPSNCVPLRSCVSMLDYFIPTALAASAFVPDPNATVYDLGEGVVLECDNEADDGGWTLLINVTAGTGSCPSAWLYDTPNGIPVCRRQNDATCDRVVFPISLTYTQLRGTARGVQYGSTDAFHVQSEDINTTFMDGVLLARLHPTLLTRSHVWTFAAGLGRTHSVSQSSLCPCQQDSSVSAPLVIGNDWFCESNNDDSEVSSQWYTERLMWDSEDCDATSTCCDRGGPWFSRTFAPESRDVEVSICSNQPKSNEDIGIVYLLVYGRESVPGSDADSDGILGGLDNCPYASNALQTDTNGDGVGDAC